MTPQQNILQFASQLKENNTREWFGDNKEWYNQVKEEFENLTELMIQKISLFDSSVKHLSPKDCMFRIYRDIRFSPDKTPYKTYFGSYIAAPNGKKSMRSGYYLHLEPCCSFASVGIWSPRPDILKALRQSVFDNIDELNEILKNPDFKRYFKSLSQEDKLKTVPRGFPKDWENVELLKLKHFFVEYKLQDVLLESIDFVSNLAKVYKSGYAFHEFLNYTVDELI